MVAEQLEQRHRQVLAGGDRTPAAHRVEPHRDAVLRHQVRVLAAVHGEFAYVRVRLLDRLLVDLLLRRERLLPQEIDRQVKELAAAPSGSMFSIAPISPSGWRSRLPMPYEPEYSGGASARLA